MRAWVGAFAVCTALLLPDPVLASRTLEAGRGHNLAVTPAGEVWSWGMNALGRLGSATTTNSSIPVRAGTLTGVTAISARGRHTLALRSDGAWWLAGRSGSSLGTASSAAILVTLYPGAYTAIVSGVGGGGRGGDRRSAVGTTSVARQVTVSNSGRIIGPSRLPAPQPSGAPKNRGRNGAP